VGIERGSTRSHCVENWLWNRPVIPNLDYAYSQGYEPGYLGVREKKLIMAEKGTYVNIEI